MRDQDREELTTGVEALDSVLDGGMLVGSLVSVTAAAGSQSDVLLQAMVGAHESVYVSLNRSCESVRRELAVSRYSGARDDVSVVRVTGESPVKCVEEIVEREVGAGDASVLVLNPVGVLEGAVSASRYREFLNALQCVLFEEDAVGVLACPVETSGNELRSVSVSVSDVVVSVDREVDGVTVREFLDVAKNRFGGVAGERVRVKIGEVVEIDNSRGY